MYTQEDYSISERKLECSKVKSTLIYLKDNYNDDSPVFMELLNNAINEIEENKGVGVTPQTYNIIIKALLSFVPDNIKAY